MTLRFAAAQARLNKAVFAHLSNAEVTVAGVALTGIFDAGYALADAGPFGVSGSNPSLTIATADLPATPVGLPVVHAGINYTIVEHQPDGTGISLLQLRRA